MDSGSNETNYWPGFVDALSNVVLTLVFVLVIFVFALVMASNKVEEKMKQITDAQKTEKTETKDYQAEIEELKNKLSITEQKVKEYESITLGQSKDESDTGKLVHESKNQIDDGLQIYIQKQEKEIHQGSTNSLTEEKDKISLVFPETTSTLDAQAQEQLIGAFKNKLNDMGSAKIIIKSVLEKGTFSASERIAYYRALSVRNILISEVGIPADRITTSIIKTENPEQGRVDIIFVHDER